MVIIILGLIIFFGVHSLSIYNFQLRNSLLAQHGEGRFKGLYSLVSLIGFALIVWGYGQARLSPTVVYVPPAGLKHATLLLMLPFFVLFLSTYLPGKIKATLKHPMLVSIKLWALAHLLANGMLHDVILFVAFLAWAVVDRISVKKRPAAEVVPASFNKNDVIAIVGGLILYVVFSMWLHVLLIGVAPITK